MAKSETKLSLDDVKAYARAASPRMWVDIRDGGKGFRLTAYPTGERASRVHTDFTFKAGWQKRFTDQVEAFRWQCEHHDRAVAKERARIDAQREAQRKADARDAEIEDAIVASGFKRTANANANKRCLTIDWHGMSGEQIKNILTSIKGLVC